jgi:chromosome segregation ATPase
MIKLEAKNSLVMEGGGPGDTITVNGFPLWKQDSCPGRDAEGSEDRVSCSTLSLNEQGKVAGLTSRTSKTSSSSSHLLALRGNGESWSSPVTLAMENIFHKKRNEELASYNKKLEEELEKLREMTESNQEMHKVMDRELRGLKEEMHKREEQERQHGAIITKMEEELRRKCEDFEELVELFEEVKRRSGDGMSSCHPKEEEMEKSNSIIVTSQLLPAHLLGELIGQEEPVTEP